MARGKLLELLRPDENGKVQTVHASEVFGIIRSMSAFRLTGGNRDYLVIGSDSGKIAILEFSAEKGQFERVHAETYGKTGCRRVVPGQYVAADPRGRAVMVGAEEAEALGVRFAGERVELTGGPAELRKLLPPGALRPYAAGRCTTKI